MDTKWLQDFLALTEFKNFSKAAKARHITQPAFGRHIRALEQAVGMQLVDRTTNPIQLTPAGQEFHVTAHHLISQLQQGLNQLNALNQHDFNPLRISTPHALSQVTLEHILNHPEFGQSQQVSLDVQKVEDGICALIEGQADFLLAFDAMDLMQPSFEHQVVGCGQYLLVSAADAKGNPLFSLDQGQPVPYLQYSAKSYSARLIEEKFGKSLSFETQVKFESSMCQLHKEMALKGQGLAWLPDCMISQELDQGELIAIDPMQWSIDYQIRCYRRQVRLSSQAEEFWTWLVEQVMQGWQISRHR